MGSVDVEIVVAVVHRMLQAAERADPSKHVGRLMAKAERPM